MTRPRCDWAGCANPASSYVDGWHHCRPHLAEHHRLVAADYHQQQQAATPLISRNGKVAACGTRSGFNRHKRLGEQPCTRCTVMEQEYQQLRQQRRRKAAS